MMYLRIAFLLLGVHFFQQGQAQSVKPGPWLFTLTREGGIPVYVNAKIEQLENKVELVFINDTEEIRVGKISISRDSANFSMPLFENNFRLKIASDTRLVGVMEKGTSGALQVWQVEAIQGSAERIPIANGPASVNLTGRWSMEFQRPDGSWRPAIAEWKQQGNTLTGTIINPSGDYRFLQGKVWGNKMYVTAFDGAHIYAFTANLPNDSTINNGIFFSGRAPGDAFRATKNPLAKLPELAAVTELKSGQSKLNFRFPDLDSQLVSINDSRFKNKVVVVQLMGSWCPNCMDETQFLSAFYNNQTTKQVEMVALAYELSTDFNRSANSLRKFKNRFGVQYPMLITGVRSADADKAEKTIPQLTDIKFFPTTLFIDKNGVVRKVHSGFNGPGTGAYFESYKKEFYALIEALVNE